MVVVALTGNSETSLWPKTPDLGITRGINNFFNTVIDTNIFGLTSLASSSATGILGFYALSKYQAKGDPRQLLGYAGTALIIAIASSQGERNIGLSLSQKAAVGITSFALASLPTTIPIAREWYKDRGGAIPILNSIVKATVDATTRVLQEEGGLLKFAERIAQQVVLTIPRPEFYDRWNHRWK